jgi:hypothetical protein
MRSASPESAKLLADMSALLAEFTARVDCGESVADLLQKDALLKTPRGETRGRDAIATLFSAVFERRKKSEQIARHSSLNLHVRLMSANCIEVRSLLMAFSLPEVKDGLGSLLIGDQVDIVALEPDGDYKFAARTLTPALEFSVVPKARTDQQARPISD